MEIDRELDRPGEGINEPLVLNMDVGGNGGALPNYDHSIAPDLASPVEVYLSGVNPGYHVRGIPLDARSVLSASATGHARIRLGQRQFNGEMKSTAFKKVKEK